MWHFVSAAPPLLAMIGQMEMIILAVVILLLFGSRLPSLMRSLGSSVVSFKKGMREADDEDPDRLERGEPK